MAYVDSTNLIETWERGRGWRNWADKRAAYYKGQQAILEKRGVRTDGKDYNKAVMNWIDIFVNRFVGFLGNKAFAVSVDDATDGKEAASAADNYAEVYEDQGLDGKDSLELRYSLLYGYAVEVVGYDSDDSKPLIDVYDPREWYFIEDENGVAVEAVRRMEVAEGTVLDGELQEKESVRWWVYDTDAVNVYDGDKNPVKNSELSGAHEFGVLPVFRWSISEGREGLISDSILNLQDRFNDMLSAHLDDVETDIDSLLKLQGVSPDEWVRVDAETGKTIGQIVKEQGAICLQDSNSNAEFVNRGFSYDKMEFTLAGLRELLHTSAGVPDLEEIVGATGNTSGIALKLRFQQMIERAGEFATHISRSIRRRIDILNFIWSVKNMPELEDYTVTVSYEIPVNETEIWQSVGSLDPYLSAKDILRLIPSVKDPDRALENKKRELVERPAMVAASERLAQTTANATRATQIGAQAEAPGEISELTQDAVRAEMETILAEANADLPGDQELDEAIERMIEIMRNEVGS